jgi:hypothetical protein
VAAGKIRKCESKSSLRSKGSGGSPNQKMTDGFQAQRENTKKIQIYGKKTAPPVLAKG